jgi:hypothetical protein
VGGHTITATYNGDPGIFNGSSGTTSVTVSTDATTTKVASSLNPSTVGQSVTFTATVTANSPGSGTPTGTATFQDGSTILATVALSSGSAAFTTSSLSAGSHSITVTYNGDSHFTASTSAVLTQQVNGGQTATRLGSANPGVEGSATGAASAPAGATAAAPAPTDSLQTVVRGASRLLATAGQTIAAGPSGSLASPTLPTTSLASFSVVAQIVEEAGEGWGTILGRQPEAKAVLSTSAATEEPEQE